MKKIKIYAEMLEEKVLKQFNTAMSLECNIQGALMADAHVGYTLPIGAVIKSKNKIFPSYVGYDIGCGMCAVKLDMKKDNVNLVNLKNKISKKIPLGKGKYKNKQNYKPLPFSQAASNFYENLGRYQLGTLGGGNHFIEIGEGKDKNLWIIIHSGSRGFGAKIAEYYMRLAYLKNLDTKALEDEFRKNNLELKKYNIEEYEKKKEKYILKESKQAPRKNLEEHYGFELDSKEGQEYILDMNCALQFALDNRKAMIKKILEFLGNPEELNFINRNHNHAQIIGEHVIHRKGATHANKNMLGVIPGNMKDGSFIVKGKGNSDSLNSSSHGAGRVLSRKAAFDNLDYDEFNEEMKDIVTNHGKSTLDEAPKAYKNIFEVMKLQEDLVEIIDYVKPILNIKG